MKTRKIIEIIRWGLVNSSVLFFLSGSTDKAVFTILLAIFVTLAIELRQ